jgi:hypothetical protein
MNLQNHQPISPKGRCIMENQQKYQQKIWLPLLFFSSLLFTVSAEAQICTQPPQNLMTWWTLDDPQGSSTVVDTVGSNDGTVFGGTLLGVPGEVATAARFDGQDGFIVAHLPTAQVFSQYTIDLWVKASWASQSAFTGIFNNFNRFPFNAGPLDSLQIDVDGGTPGNYRVFFDHTVFGTTNTCEAEFPNCFVIFGPVTTDWQHLAVTYDGTTVKTYVNGNVQNSAAVDSTLAGVVFRDIVLGSNRTGSLYFAGIADELEIFNRALSGSEIASIAAAGSAGKCNILIDVNPGSGPNSINPKSNGVIPVAILSNARFDATDINPATLRFGPKQANAVHSGTEDVNGDGLADLVVQFRTQDTGIQCGDTQVGLTGATTEGIPVRGADSITTVGCPKK